MNADTDWDTDLIIHRLCESELGKVPYDGAAHDHDGSESGDGSSNA